MALVNNMLWRITQFGIKAIYCIIMITAETFYKWGGATVRNKLLDTFIFKRWRIDQSATLKNETIINKHAWLVNTSSFKGESVE